MPESWQMETRHRHTLTKVLLDTWSHSFLAGHGSPVVVAEVPFCFFPLQVVVDGKISRNILHRTSGKRTLLWKMWPFSLLIYPLRMVTFHSYASLPEGNNLWFLSLGMINISICVCVC